MMNYCMLCYNKKGQKYSLRSLPVNTVGKRITSTYKQKQTEKDKKTTGRYNDKGNKGAIMTTDDLFT